MPDIGDTKAGGSTGLKDGASTRGSTSGNTSGVGGGGGGGGGSTGTRGSSTGGVGAGNGSNAPGNSGGGGQNSGVGRDSTRGLGQGAGGSAIGRTSSPTGNGGQGAPGSSPASAGGLRGAGGNYGPGSGRPSTASVSQPSGYRTPNNPTGGQISAPARTTPSAGALGSVGGWNARMGANPTAAPSAVTAQNPSPVTYRGPQQQPSYDPLSGVTQAPRYNMAQELGYAARDAWGNITNAASSVMNAMPDISFSLDGTTNPQAAGLGRFAGVPTVPRAPAPAPGIGPGGFAMPAAAPQPTSYGTGVPAPQTISGALSSVPGLTYGNPITNDPRASMQRALEGYQAERAAVDDAISRGTTLANAPQTDIFSKTDMEQAAPVRSAAGTWTQSYDAPPQAMTPATDPINNPLASPAAKYAEAIGPVAPSQGMSVQGGIGMAGVPMSGSNVLNSQSMADAGMMNDFYGGAGSFSGTIQPASAPPDDLGVVDQSAPLSGFMSPEVKRATQYGYDTLYSPNALDDLYSGINAYGIDDLERRIAAEQALLGQTIDASQYGGVVTANLNNKIDVPLGSARTVDPFNADVITHWTGGRAPLARISGNGYATVIDDQGNINYNRAFDADGNMLNTNHTKGMNTGNFGIASQGIEPNAAQLDAARALGGNWFNGDASVSTHGYEAGTRITNGDRPRADIRNKDGSYSARPDREGVGLASAFTGQDDVGKTWTRTSLSDDRPVTMASGLGQGTRETAIANSRAGNASPSQQDEFSIADGFDGGMTPASGYTYDGSYGPQREQRYYSTPSRGTVPEGWGMTLDEAYSNEGPARTGLYPGRGDVNLGGYVTQDKPSFAPLDNRMTSDEGFDPTGVYGPRLSGGQYPANDIYGEPVLKSVTVPSWNQSTYTGPPRAPTEIDVNGALHVADALDGYNPLGSLSPKYYGPVNQPSFDDFQPEFDQDRMHVVGGGGFQAFNTPLGVAGPDTDVGKRLSPERRDRFYNGPPPDEMVSAGDEPSADGPQHPIYGGDYGDIQMPEKPKVYKAGKAIAGAVTQGAGSMFLTGLEKLGDFEWSRMSAEERLALIDKWDRQNADYIRNRTDGRGGKAELTDRLFANSSSGSGARRGTRRPDDDGSDVIPPPVVNDLAREYLGPTDPYNYGFGPEYTYYGT